MNVKSFIISMYAVALFIVLRRWYNEGHTGLPAPSVITGPSYLYGVLALTSDYLEGLPTVLAAGLTVGLFYATRTQPKQQPSQAPAGKPIGQRRAVATPANSRQVKPATR